ncbi:hypothetical protein C5167_047583 [Papaver somniferum]|uniref:RING-type E3 ubiquitin transferase n=1 Tax=Papaver somniferum TaxID=3469 RepID=A0A4Y7LH38_PAPSO|nr:hypothetical protein C5167_047583 [Papaver somniferum]
MGASTIILPLFLLFFLCYPHFTVSAKNCRNNQCSKGEPRISYPFRIKGRQDKECGFPGFDLSCDNMSRTVMDLPFSGRFFVDKIDYGSTYNEIQLRDPDNCLTRRFLNHLNLFGTPFIEINFTDYSFYNCSTNDSNYFPASSTSVSCLSSSTYTVIATSPGSLPSSWLYDKDSMRNTRKFLISIGIIFPILFVSFMYCISRSDANSPSQDVSSRVVQTTPLSVINSTGLSGSAIQSFPIVVLGESGRLPNPDINACAICLLGYEPKEILKSIPACNHYFHANCIDVWLHLKSSCPVCRKPPNFRPLVIL